MGGSHLRIVSGLGGCFNCRTGHQYTTAGNLFSCFIVQNRARLIGRHILYQRNSYEISGVSEK